METVSQTNVSRPATVKTYLISFLVILFLLVLIMIIMGRPVNAILEAGFACSVLLFTVYTIACMMQGNMEELFGTHTETVLLSNSRENVNTGPVTSGQASSRGRPSPIRREYNPLECSSAGSMQARFIQIIGPMNISEQAVPDAASSSNQPNAVRNASFAVTSLAGTSTPRTGFLFRSGHCRDCQANRQIIEDLPPPYESLDITQDSDVSSVEITAYGDPPPYPGTPDERDVEGNMRDFKVSPV